MSRWGKSSFSGWEDHPAVQEALREDRRNRGVSGEDLARPVEKVSAGEVVGLSLDPGKTTGAALLLGGGSLSCVTTDFWGAVKLMKEKRPQIVIVEDPRLNPTTFGHGESAPAKREKISRNVGSNMREAALLLEKARALGFEVVSHKPQSGKWSREECRTATGYDGSPNNEHVRDAIRAIKAKIHLFKPKHRI